MKCLRKYKWVKMRRDIEIEGKGLMSHYIRLAGRVAFRKGTAHYCGFENPVEPGIWAGGIVGLKSILGVKKRWEAFRIMNQLQELGYLTWTLDPETKLLPYKITDWVVECSGAPCEEGAVYASTGYGFYCMPRTITQRLVDKGYKFGPADAFLDLWVHTVFRDYGNIFSFLTPAIQYGKYGSVLTLETLGKRWGWEKTKVWRFFKKFGEDFALYRLPGTYGCVICNLSYPCQTGITPPSKECVVRIWELIRIRARNTHTEGTDNQRINRFVAWRSREVAKTLEDNAARNESGKSSDFQDGSENCVADLDTITRAYFSHGRNCKHSRNCIYDCSSRYAKAVSDSSRRLANMMTNILKLNRLENQQIYPQAAEYDLSEQLCDCLLQFENVWEKKDIEIETDIADCVTVKADAELLSLVWNNLFSNAFKFTEPGGKVSVSLTITDHHAIVKVNDTGCGMSAEVGSHIFEKFYQGDTSHATQGNGLGLALVKRVIDIMQGTIGVESVLGKGTTFTVKIRRT